MTVSNILLPFSQPERVGQAFQSQSADAYDWGAPILTDAGVLTPHKNLVCKYVTAATVDINADELILRGTNAAVLASSVDLTVDITASGANGLDTGSEATSTWYYLWVIYNPTSGTVAGLLSASSTSPTMPAGYTFKGLVGAVLNDASNDILEFHQFGNKVATVQVVDLNAGTASTPTSFSVTAPPIATRSLASARVREASGTSALCYFYSDSSGGLGYVELFFRAATADIRSTIYIEMPLVTAQTLWYETSATDQAYWYTNGWEY